MVYVLRVILIAAYTVFWSVACALAAPFSGELVTRLATIWLRWIFATCRIEVEARGLENFNPAQPVVVMANHESVLDIGALILTLPVSWRFVAKRELLRVPFFGWALGLSDQIIIDRQNRAKAVASLRRAARRVAGGVNVIIFPEGTRSRDGKLRAFKSGGFHLALEAGVPILPAAVSGGRALTPPHSLKVKSGRMRVCYGRPIASAGLGLEAREQLKAQVRRAIAEGLAAPQ